MNFLQSHKHNKKTSRSRPATFEHLEDRRLLSTYLGAAFTINTRIEAEHFDLGGEGVGFHDTTAANLGGALRAAEGVDIAATLDTDGGFAITDTAPGEWLAYTLTVPTTGSYFIETRIASSKTGGSIHYEWNGQNVSGSIPIPNTGSNSTYWTLKTGPIPLSAGTRTLRLAFNNIGTASLGNLNWIRLTPYGTTSGGGTGGGGTGGGTTITNGLKATYFDNMDFTGRTVSRTDANINFNWDNKSPVSLIAPTTFSVRWTGKIKAAKSERYTFHARVDDGVRLFVNGQRLLDCWRPQAATDVTSASINLVAGQKYDIKVEYFQRFGGAQISLKWSSPTTPKQLIPNTQLFTG
jgi:hypothetical protein